MKIHNNKAKRFALMLLVVFTACKKLDLEPTNGSTEENFWQSENQVLSVLNSAYSQMYDSNSFFFSEAMSDNAYNGRGDNEGAASIAAGTYDPSLARFKDEWSRRYTAIKTCNRLLDNIGKATTVAATTRDRVIGEARFIRAYQYMQLYTWFGDVPLFTKDITEQESRTVSRTPRAQVVSFVLTELDAAAAALPVNTAYNDPDRGRVTKGAAIALKARALLYEGRWQDVVTTCEQLMGGTNGTYNLFSSYEGVFLPQNEYNSEVIFDLQYVPTDRMYSLFFDLAPLSVGARLNVMAPTQELVDSYPMLNGKGIKDSGSGYDENNPYINRDPRLTATVVYHLYPWRKPDNTVQTIYIKPGTAPDDRTRVDEYAPGSVSSPTGYYIRKYYDPTSAANFQSGLNLILIRYADVLLMYAEAKNELNAMTGDVWNQTIRALRVRAGFTDPAALNFSTSDQASLRNVIRNERRVEFAMEGLRIYDIRRWRIAETVLNGWAHGAKYGPANIDNGYIRANLRTFNPSRNYLWPIPRDERSLNPNLSQNPGWN